MRAETLLLCVCVCVCVCVSVSVWEEREEGSSRVLARKGDTKARGQEKRLLRQRGGDQGQTGLVADVPG